MSIGAHARSTIRSWVPEAGLYREADRCSDHIAVDEVLPQLDDEQY